MSEFVCENCGCIIEDESKMVTAADGKHFCDDDCAHESDYEICVDCGDWVSCDEMTYIEDYGYVCDLCYSDGDYCICDDCGDHCRYDDMRHDDYGNHVCDACFERHNWNICDDCGRLIYESDIYYDDYDNCYCESCYEENHRSRAIHDYSYKPDPDFYATDNEPEDERALYMGIELEVDDGSDPERLAEILQDKVAEIYCKHDGSLDDGVEIVSHPCTLAYHLNDLDWHYICDESVRRGFKSHDAGTCGLHVHVNRDFFGDEGTERDLNIAKVILLVNRFWDSHIVPFSRRTYDQLRHWANKNNMELEEDDTEYTLVDKVRDQRREGRYQAVNLTNRNTIEFRFFRGTLRENTFRATLQFVDTLCRYAKKMPVDEINTVAWEDLFRNATQYEELITYLSERTHFNDEEVM